MSADLPDTPIGLPARPRGRYVLSVSRAIGLIFLLGCAFGVMAMVGRAVREARMAARAAQCLCNLCSIKLALLNYHEVHGCFPPAYLADPEGRPMHSWRVLILPFMEHKALFDAYNFAEPWDGPSNRRLLNQMPNVWACPNHRDPGKTHLTDYVAITGPGTAFPGAESVTVADITDGTSNTIMVVEAAGLDVPWTAPIDLDVRRMSLRINDLTRPSIASYDPGGPAVLAADSFTVRLPETTPAASLRAMLTIAGDEPAELTRPLRH